MTFSFWIISALVIGICVFVFKKAVSNDAQNDYRLRDILSNVDEDDIFADPKLREPQKEAVPVYGNTEKEEEYSYSKNYSTNTYSTTTHEQRTEKKEEEKVYYEKVNDDACDDYSKNDYKTTESYTDEEENEDYEDDDYTNQFEKGLKPQKQSLGRRLFDTIKTFWRGITFTIGLLVTIYSFGGLATQVQTSNDAIVYSIWLLIGVVLIK